MSWLQVYKLRLRCFEHIAASGRVIFVIQLQFGQQEDSHAADLTKRSYSEFRTLWKDLLRATSGGLDDLDGRSDSRRSSRRFSSRESWSNVSKLLTGTFGGGGAVGGESILSMKKKKRCRCTETSCPFQRLYHLLKDFPFPRKQILQHKDANALEHRRAELEDFLVQVQRFFCGYPRSFLETAASTQRCDVLQLMSAFTGMDKRPASLSVVHNAFTSNFRPERPRHFSYCVSPSVSPSPTLLTDTTENAEELLPMDGRISDNQKYERPSHASIRTSTVRASSSLPPSLPQLQIKSADVMTFQASLSDVRDSILRQMGDEVQNALERDQLSDETQWEFALFHAAERGMYAEVVTIIRRGTNVNCSVWGGATPLHAASDAGQMHVVQYLLAHGADIDYQGPIGMTALMYAVNNSQLETTKVLLRAGADVNLCNIRNVSPVHLAVTNCSMTTLLLLLDHGATVDVPNAVNGRTPLHIATEADHKDICDVLLKYGARASHCSISGMETAELVSEQENWRVQELCTQYKRDTMATFLEDIDEDGVREDSTKSSEELTGRNFCALLEYIDEKEGGAGKHGDQKEDVSMITLYGRTYAVL